MPYTTDQATDDAFLRTLLLEMGAQRHLPALLDMVVERLAALPAVALARVWLLRPGDLCSGCRAASRCRDRSRCLHLVASSGRSTDDRTRWDRTDGGFRRIPLGDRMIGSVANHDCGITVVDVREDAAWVEDPGWAAREGVLGLTAKPIAIDGRVLGVMGLFTRTPFDLPMCQLAGILAHHAAVSIANAEAFAEVERLTRALAAENDLLRAEIDAGNGGEIVGTSPGIQAVIERIALVAPTPASVLITGESGTGKELVAREIHRRSPRASGPLVRVNCAAIPESLFESEFFGHAKGAFTGAGSDRAGRFAAAEGGTILLDEVGEIPLAMQGKLLRILQEGTYERVGEERTRTVDVRVLAATNRDLAAEMAAGRFRADLYYRLHVVPVHLPPLRERRGDIAAIAARILARIAHRFDRPTPSLSRADLLRLEAHPWPGNIRELANVLERGLVTGRDGRIAIDLPAEPAGPGRPAAGEGHPFLTESELVDLEKAQLQAALAAAGGRVAGPGGAAQLFGLKPTTFLARLRRHGLR